MPISSVTLSLNSALQHGKLTEKTVRNAIGEPAELRANTRHELKTLLTTKPDAFEPAARTALEVALATPEKTFDPPLAKWSAFSRVDTKGIAYAPASGSLYSSGIHSGDVFQGELGNCFFLATIAGFADSRPNAITDAITDNGNGTYTVRFYEDDPVYGVQATYVTVDADFPMRDGRNVYAQTVFGELWPAVLEKAYAKFKGSYGAIGNGGVPGQVAFDLTGETPSLRLVGLTSEKKTFERVERALANAQPVTVATLPEALSKNSKVKGIVGGHVYSVTRTYEENGQRFIEVRNPWGDQPEVVTPRGVIRTGMGQFSLTVDEFKAAFPAAFIAD